MDSEQSELFSAPRTPQPFKRFRVKLAFAQPPRSAQVAPCAGAAGTRGDQPAACCGCGERHPERRGTGGWWDPSALKNCGARVDAPSCA